MACYSYYTITVHQIVLTRIPKTYGDYNSACIGEVGNDRLIKFASRRYRCSDREQKIIGSQPALNSAKIAANEKTAGNSSSIYDSLSRQNNLRSEHASMLSHPSCLPAIELKLLQLLSESLRYQDSLIQ